MAYDESDDQGYGPGVGRRPVAFVATTSLEMFYVTPGGRLMSATIRRSAPYVLPELARSLFAREDLVSGLAQPAGDGERFLVATVE